MPKLFQAPVGHHRIYITKRRYDLCPARAKCDAGILRREFFVRSLAFFTPQSRPSMIGLIPIFTAERYAQQFLRKNV